MSASRDRRLILSTAFLRAVGTGMTGVLAGLYLARLGLDAAHAGLVIGAGLGGSAAATLLATTSADAFGRRRFLVLLSLFGTAGLLAMLAARDVTPLVVFAALGMLNGMGRDRGAALVIEQAILPATTTDDRRTRTFAWYNVLQDAGHAVGSLLAGLPAWVGMAFAGGFASAGSAHAPGNAAAVTAGAAGVAAASPTADRELLLLACGLAFAALLGACVIILYLRLSPAVESAAPRARVVVSPSTRRILWRISSLFALDSLGGGFLTASLVAWFFYERFGVDAGTLGLLFFGARVLNAFSHLGAAWLARRIGLVNTMVFTHIPSSLLLVTVAIAPNFAVAAVLFLLREGLVEMDVPTRQSYVMAVVRPQERTLASGVTHLVRVAAWAVGPALAGWAMQKYSIAAPLAIAAGLKIAYDLMLWLAFRHVKPPEETATSG
ncbi:MAG: MFS transporter [Candidatus Eisenbacteria bacterium]